MKSKIYLGKYRVSGNELETVGECVGSPLAYEGIDTESGKKVVVELVPIASLKGSERERLEAEATAAKQLNHVNIPVLYDFGVQDGHLVYVTEDFEGTLADEWVNAHGPLPVGPVLRIASQVVSALGAAAFHQIVHRAINPSNLILVAGQTADGEWPLVKVLHFGGVAPMSSDDGGAVATFDKSLHYVSPEQIQKGTVDFRSEIYSLGCTMWFLLTGVPPLVAPDKSAAVTSAAPGSKASAIPRRVRRLLAQMLASDPNARPRDPFELYRKLQDCLLHVERRMGFRLPASRRNTGEIEDLPRRRPIRAVALAALFLALTALAGLFL